MKHAINPLKPYAPDISIISIDNSCSIDKALTEELARVDGVKRVYGRSFAYDLPIRTQKEPGQAYLISYESCQFDWAKDSLIDGSLSEVLEREGILAVYHGENSLAKGENVAIDWGEGEKQFTVSGILSDCPFTSADGEEILICSEKTFESLTGRKDYTIIDVQLERNAGDDVVSQIRALGGENVIFSDCRLSNAEVKGAMYSFQLFVYGFPE